MIMNVANDPEPPCPLGFSYVLNIEIFEGSIVAVCAPKSFLPPYRSYLLQRGVVARGSHEDDRIQDQDWQAGTRIVETQEVHRDAVVAMLEILTVMTDSELRTSRTCREWWSFNFDKER